MKKIMALGFSIIVFLLSSTAQTLISAPQMENRITITKKIGRSLTIHRIPAPGFKNPDGSITYPIHIMVAVHGEPFPEPRPGTMTCYDDGSYKGHIEDGTQITCDPIPEGVFEGDATINTPYGPISGEWSGGL